jgi:hypothetical protein
MKPFDCASIARRLHAFHDGELPVNEQIAVNAHLTECRECAAHSAELQLLRNALLTLAPGRPGLSKEEASGFSAAVVSRLKAEREASLFARVRLMFDDMHLVYAGLGAAAATMVCVIVVLGMMRFATSERPDSLFGIMNVLGMPLECDAVIVVGDEVAGCRERLAERFQRANETAEQDAVFTLDSLVIRQGRLSSLETLKSGGRRSSNQAEAIEELLDAACRARVDLQPTGGSSNGGMVRLVARETVRASKLPPIDLQLPAGKKRADTGSASSGLRT